MIIKKIEILKKQRKLNNLDIAEACNMSCGGFELMLKTGDMKVSTLQLIANYFNVPITYFFENEEIVVDGKEVKAKQIDMIFDALKEVVKEKIM